MDWSPWNLSEAFAGIVFPIIWNKRGKKIFIDPYLLARNRRMIALGYDFRGMLDPKN